jgi:hypothetical protein
MIGSLLWIILGVNVQLQIGDANGFMFSDLMSSNPLAAKQSLGLRNFQSLTFQYI